MMKQKILFISIALFAGLFIGWLIFYPSGRASDNADKLTEETDAKVWTCAMHPQIRMHEPGKCPICGMDLIPLSTAGSSSMDPDAVTMSKEAAALANVLTSVAGRHQPVKEIRLYGKVQADERHLQSQVAHIPGRIETLNVNFTGEPVSEGQILAKIYSPELVNAQQELLEAAKEKLSQTSIYEAAREKLKQWKVTDNQISAIEESGITQSTVDIVSNSNGIVTNRRVNTGDYVSQGTVLFEIADLSKVWILFDAYERDLQFLKKGESVSFTFQSLPGIKYSGNIAFIDPVIDPVTRVSKVRVEAGNQSGKLKPEMFATGIVTSALEGYSDKLVIPRSSVLWTGKRSVVYVKQPSTDQLVFKMREIELGPLLGEAFIVMSGLSEGEEVVTSGAFSVDAAAQLEGKASMMNVNMADNMTHSTFNVSGNCEMCKERIENAALSVIGVSVAVWDMSTKKISIDFDKSITDQVSIEKAIANVGHDTELFKADDAVYKALPACCLYRK